MSEYTTHFVMITVEDGKPVRYRHINGKTGIDEPGVVNGILALKSNYEKAYLVTSTDSYQWLKHAKDDKILISKEIGFETDKPIIAPFLWKLIDTTEIEEDAQDVIVKGLETGNEG